MDSSEKICNLIGLFLKTKILSSSLQILSFKTFTRFHLELEDFVWGFLSNIFNRRTSSWGVDESWTASFSVKSKTQIQFFFDANFLNKIYSVTWNSILSTLFGYQMVTKHLFSNVLSTCCIINEVDSSLEASFLEVSESTASSENLSLDDHASINLASNIMGLRWREGYISK